jgi:peptidyl-prolyl cis-trans isomerase SurA
MMHRFPSFPTLLAASLAVFAIPGVAQSRSSSYQESSPYHGQVVEEIVARVNDQVISLSDYDRAQQQLDQEAQQEGWSQQQLYKQKHDLLRSLIDKQLLLSKGKEMGISGDDGVIQRLDQMRRQYHLATMDDLQKAAEAQGVSWEDLKEQIRENVITSDVISQEVAPKIIVSPSEIQEYYNEHKKDFEQPEQERLSEILIPTPNPDDAAQVATAEKQADDIESRLKAGADFATLAKADSSGPTAAQGGDLGEYKRGVLPRVMEDATFQLGPGQWTKPIRTKQGWLILQVTQHENAGLQPLSAVQDQIQQTIGMQKMQPALREYLTRLRNQAYITIRPGYEDAGSSPGEMKFIQSAYVAPGAKHKKRETRSRFRAKPRRKAKPQAAHLQTVAEKTTRSTEGRIQKPGKKEKIRFGQAPRETLPTETTRNVDAGAGEGNTAAQESGNATLTDSSGKIVDTSSPAPQQKKVRFQDQKELPKAKQWKNRPKQKYVAPEAPAAELAKEKRQSQAYGLRGDTTHPKKVNPAKEGPKRRLSDQDKKRKKQDQSNPPEQPNAAPPSGAVPPASTGPSGSTPQ